MEAEVGAAVTCAQNMIYTKNIFGSLEVSVKPPIVLEIDDYRAVALLNSWSIWGCIRYVGMMLNYLQ